MKSIGVVIAPPLEYNAKENRLHIISSDIDPLSLRRYILYWDKIDYPSNRMISFGESPDISYLSRAGILNRTNVSIPPGDVTDAPIRAQVTAYLQLSNNEPGQWSLAQDSANFRHFIPSNLSVDLKSFEIDLYNALPIPSQDIPLPDVLEFKQKRKDELLAFRIAMNEIYLAVANSNDIPRGKILSVQKLEKALADLNRVAKEGFVSKLLSGFKVVLSGKTIAEGAAAGAAAASIIGFDASLGGMIGGVASCIQFEYKISRGPKGLTDDLRDFAYVFRVKEEFNV